jgi:hypothetical protein
MVPPRERLDFNPRLLRGFDRWVYEKIREIQTQLKTIEEQLPDSRDWPTREIPPDAE